MDILFASSKGSQYRYFKALTKKLPFDCKITTLYPCVPDINDVRLLDGDLLRKGVFFHVSRKKVKSDAEWLPNWVWTLYKLKAYVRFSLIFLSFYAYFSKHQVKYVGVWNGHRLPEMAIKLAARALGVKVIFFENGLLPNTTTMDFTGVNDKNSLPRKAMFYQEFASGLTTGVFSETRLVKRNPHKSKKNQQFMGRPHNTRFLFVPFQVGFDSQVLINSNWITSMKQFYTELECLIDSIEDKDLVLVVKEHPSDPKCFQSLYDKHPRIHFSNESTESLIIESEGVITINSSVGLESLLLGKKVIVLGESCYKIPRIALSASSSNELVDVVNGLSDWCYDEDSLRGYLEYLSREYSLEGAWQKQLDNPSIEHVNGIINKLNGKPVDNKQIFHISTSPILVS